MKTLELTKDACNMIVEALSSKIAMWNEHNEVIAMHGTDEQIEKFIKDNNEKIAKLKTLINYIEA